MQVINCNSKRSVLNASASNRKLKGLMEHYEPPVQVPYTCLNYVEAFCPGEIEDRSICCIDGDIGELITKIK